MTPTLSIVVPVHNGQHGLAEYVHRVLEVAEELTSRFEVLVVDDGSTDETSETAWELAREYPQIRVFRFGRRLGPSAALAGMEHARASRAFVCRWPDPTAPAQLRHWWRRTETAPQRPHWRSARRPAGRGLLGPSQAAPAV